MFVALAVFCSLAVVITATAVGWFALGLRRAASTAARRQAEALERIEALDTLEQIRALDARVEQLERVTREQAVVGIVVGNLLVERGLIEEEELAEAHQRLVVEPAIIDQENEALLAELPDSESVRLRMVRNCPPTLQ